MQEPGIASVFRYDDIIGAYEGLGWPRAVIGQWVLPENDASDLVAHVVAQRPQRVLEVGTFVGVSTHLIAANLRQPFEISTVDPNLPLRIEMMSMGSKLGAVDSDRKTQVISREVSERLGFANCISYIEGGFSSVDTFSSHRVPDGAEINVVGPKVCEQRGPFDLVFIDGLHYASTVMSDLALAAAHLAPGGRILLHDCIGMWGSNVRRAVFDFLERNGDFAFQHERFSELYRSIGVLYRRSEQPSLNTRFRHAHELADLPTTFLRSLSAAILSVLSPRSLLEVRLGTDSIGLHLSGAHGVHVDSVDAMSDVNDEAAVTAGSEVIARIGNLEERYDAAVLVGIADFLSDAEFTDLAAKITELTDTVVLLATPPGEVGSAGVHSRPLRSLVTLLDSVGFDVYDAPLLELEPTQFAFIPEPIELVPTTTYMNTVLAVRRGARVPEGAALIALDGGAVSRVEDLALQRLHLGNGMRWLFRELKTTQADVEVQRRELYEIGQPRLRVGGRNLYLGRHAS